jgi:formylglycine-generating enzyme required for sulfatase activity
MSMSKAGPVTDLRQKMSWLPQLRTVPVGTGDAANAWGLFDMLGNIWEWCADKWHEDYWNCSSWAEAFDRGEKFHRVARGGAWSSRIESCSAFERARFPVNLCSGDVGLRVAMDPKMQ